MPCPTFSDAGITGTNFVTDVLFVCPRSEVHLTQPSTGNPTCPEHATIMLPHKFESWETNQPVERGFRCANLTCGIVFIEGDNEGFYTLESDGDLARYPKRD